MPASLRLVTLVFGFAAGAALAQVPVGQSLGDAPQAAPAAAGPAVSQIGIRGYPMLGDPAAPVTVVEFIDYQCPYCQAYAKNTFPRIRADYIDTGKVRYVVRDFPLAKHERARPAAIAAACAGAQDRFWEMHEALLTAGEVPGDELIEREARRLALDADVFAGCRTERRRAARLDEDIAEAAGLVSGTPTFLVGPSAGDIARGRVQRGVLGYEAFAKMLEAYLKPQ